MGRLRGWSCGLHRPSLELRTCAVLRPSPPQTPLCKGGKESGGIASIVRRVRSLHPPWPPLFKGGKARGLTFAVGSWCSSAVSVFFAGCFASAVVLRSRAAVRGKRRLLKRRRRPRRWV